MIVKDNQYRVLVFGDSLSWGYIPGTKHERFPISVRWPGLLQKKLGRNYEIIEENLNSRGIENGDSRIGKEGRSAMDYIIPCLDSHDPLDFIVVLLGTNELKAENNLTAEEIAVSMNNLLITIKNRKSQFRDNRPIIVLVAPPVVNEDTEYCKKENKYLGATEKSKKLSHEYSLVAKDMGIRFVTLSKFVNPGIDGVHLDEKGHAQTAKLIHNSLLS